MGRPPLFIYKMEVVSLLSTQFSVVGKSYLDCIFGEHGRGQHFFHIEANFFSEKCMVIPIFSLDFNSPS